MNKLKNKMAYEPSNDDRENGPWVSQTVPDEARTVKEIFQMYAKNEPLGGRIQSTMDAYSDSPQDRVTLEDPDLMELNRMDITDKHEYMEQLRQNIEHQKQRIKDAQEALLRKQAAQAAVEADIRNFESETDQSDPKKKEAEKPVKKPVAKSASKPDEV